jgi:hypothetical protein
MTWERKKELPNELEKKMKETGNEGKLNEHFYSNKNCLGTSFIKLVNFWSTYKTMLLPY